MTVASQQVAVARSPRHLVTWAGERFPLALVAVFAPACLVTVLYGRALTRPGPPALRPGDLAAFAGAWALFLLIRIVDEHKDYERDRVAHPRRVLQRGLVTLDQLKTVAGVAGAIQLAVVFASGSALGPVGLWWALTLGWLALAAMDFFLGRWVADHPVLYPLLHLPLSGLVCGWLAQLGAGARSLPPAAFAVAGLGVALSGSVDLVRKFLPGEDDSADSGDRSYLIALGARRAASVGSVAVAVQTAVLAILVRLAGGPAAALMALPVLAIGPQVALARFAGAPTPVGAGSAAARRARASMALLIPVQLAVAAVGLLVRDRGW